MSALVLATVLVCSGSWLSIFCKNPALTTCKDRGSSGSTLYVAGSVESGEDTLPRARL